MSRRRFFNSEKFLHHADIDQYYFGEIRNNFFFRNDEEGFRFAYLIPPLRERGVKRARDRPKAL